MKNYITLNGKRYYEEGGNTENPQKKLPFYPVPKSSFHRAQRLPVSQKPISKEHGHSMFNNLNDSQKQDFLQGRKKISEFLRRDTEENKALKDKYGFDLDKFDKENSDYLSGKTVDFESPNSKNVYRALQSLGRGFENDGDQGLLGRNMIHRISTFSPQNRDASASDNERRIISDLLRNSGNKNYAAIADNWYDPYESRYTKRIDPETGNSYFTIGTSYLDAGNGETAYGGTINLAIDPNGNVLKWKKPAYRNSVKDNSRFFTKSPELVDFEGEEGVDYVENYKSNDERDFREFTPSQVYSYSFRDPNNNWGEYMSHAYGGQTSRRLYAAGGSMGMIPMGEQEDYNMVGAGGSHEENPMGGVPYGMNADGSQNMVEQGEASVGNQVFSDRSSLSPELCQQLGLPEGTSPSQAMQQIEALYEQGQISDEEYQEIQNIIFQDQEMQKQNSGASYQQGGVGGPGVPQNEGIQPDMVGAGGQQFAYGGFRGFRF